MKIEAPNATVAPGEVAKVKKGAKPAMVVQPDDAAKVQLSGEVKALGKKAMAADVTQLQAAQDAKVGEVRARVQAGTYQVSGHEVAERMLSRSGRKNS